MALRGTIVKKNVKFVTMLGDVCNHTMVATCRGGSTMVETALGRVSNKARGLFRGGGLCPYHPPMGSPSRIGVADPDGI